MNSTEISSFLKRITNIGYVFNILLYRVVNKYGNMSFSQEGEDRVLYSILRGQQKGFYVDVGAHHPQRFSNTNLFYLMGWEGINIDASQEAIKLFKEDRKRDINLNMGVGLKSEQKEFIIFDEPAVNTFNKDVAKDKLKNTKFKIKERKMIQILPLSKILKKYMPKGKKIDFISIDVEGNDFEVLKSNDWKLFKPKYILVEIFGGYTMKAVTTDRVTKFLDQQGYQPIAKTLNTVIYKYI